jgi:hypothetical protein
MGCADDRQDSWYVTSLTQEGATRAQRVRIDKWPILCMAGADVNYVSVILCAWRVYVK